jgi:hypothetical protein
MVNALYVAWRGNEPNRGWGPVGRLERTDDLYRFYYTHGARQLRGFRPFPQMTDLDQVYESTELFPLFANRLLSRSRLEYDAFLHWSGFDPVSQPDPIAILGVTEGRRQTDSVEVFPAPIPDPNGNYTTKFFVHGMRWISPAALQRMQKLTPGESLQLIPESDNPYDPHAVALHAIQDPAHIGYVPRYLAQDARRLLHNNPASVHVSVERLNSDAPLKQRLLCRMSAPWPDDFAPCAGEQFEPIPQTLSAHE